jgi:mercuric reductase
MLETTAAKEGSIAAENALKETHRKLDLSAVPHAVFTNPQVASVGLTDAQVANKGIRCNCRVLDMSLVPKSAVVGDERGLIKMVIDNDTKRLLGVHIVSPIAADMINEAVMALRFKATIDDIVDTVHVFPTFTEAIKLVAESFTKDVSNMSCCVE